MSIAQLVNVITPPARGRTRTSAEWKVVEDSLDAYLPTEYKSFVDSYGAGSIDRFLWILDPFTKNRFLNLLIQSDEILRSYRLRSDGYGDSIVDPLGGGKFLPFAFTDNGDHLFWKVTEQVAGGPIRLIPSRDTIFEDFDFDLTTFLVKLLTREITVTFFPPDFPSNRPEFHLADVM